MTAEEVLKRWLNIVNPQIKRVLYKNPAVIVFWTDNTKTTAKCSLEDTFDKEKGLILAILKKYISGKEVSQLLDEWIPKNEMSEEVTLSQVFKYRDSKKNKQ